MRYLIACTLILVPFTFSPAHGATSVPNAGQLTDVIIAVKSGRYVSRNCTPVNGPYGFYGNIFCRPTQQEYLRNLGSPWPQRDPAPYPQYKYYKPKR